MALSPTYYTLDAAVTHNAMKPDDLHRILYNLWKAIAAFAYNLDEDGHAEGADYMANIGTDLNTALAQLKAPPGGETV